MQYTLLIYETAIQSVHAERARTARTYWAAIATFYDLLTQVSPSNWSHRRRLGPSLPAPKTQRLAQFHHRRCRNGVAWAVFIIGTRVEPTYVSDLHHDDSTRCRRYHVRGRRPRLPGREGPHPRAPAARTQWVRRGAGFDGPQGGRARCANPPSSVTD
jgi:hypothetical protein